MISLNDILAVDGGAAYIEHKYPDAAKSFSDKRRKFKLRNETTASASVYEKDRIWYVTDFGDDQKRRNAVDVCMREDNVDFKTAINTVAGFYNIAGATAGEIKASFDKWPAKPNEAEGAVNLVYKEFEMWELKTLFADYAWRALGQSDTERMKNAIVKCTYLHYKALASYTYTKAGVTMQYSSNANFPMFVIEEPLDEKGENKWFKIYKPKDKKEHRFFSKGEKPKDFVHGLSQLVNFVAKVRGDQAQGSVVNEDTEDGDGKKKKKVVRNEPDFKVEDLVLCTGGSDALNVFALDSRKEGNYVPYHVIWLNSESAEFSGTLYKKLKGLAHNIYNLPDLDETGKREAHKLALEYLQMKTIRLPEELRKYKDDRGNPCKDIRDFLKHYKKYDFDQLVKTALPYQFWDQEQRVDKEGDPVFKFGKPVWSYVFNNVRAYNFLYWNGFARYKSEKEKEGFFFIKIDGHVVRKVETSEIRDFVNSFLEKKFFGEDLRNVVYRSPQLSETSMANLPMVELDFQPYDAHTQFMFFQTWSEHKKAFDGSVWKITANNIEEVKGAAGKYVWAEKVLQRKVKVKEQFFKIGRDEDENWHTTFTDFDSAQPTAQMPMVMAFLIQTCRVHWRKELEERLGICTRLKLVQDRKEYAEKNNLTTEEFERIFHPKNVENSDFTKAYKEKYKFALNGYLLTDAEIKEQELHFINRCYVIGYLLHRYKNPSKPWGVWIMDNKIADEGESHGGSGKSLLVKMLVYMNLITVALDGRNPRLTDNPHIFENVDLSTDLINVDDCFDYFNFGYFYASLTSDLSANPKNKKGYTIPFEKSAKFIFSSNYGDRTTDPSSLRRKLYTVYSDYYHEDNGDYGSSKKPDEEFGRNLFTDWKDQDWEEYYNFMAQCLAFYLSCDHKVTPPMGNVTKRNLIAEMTESFKAWADVYFSPEGNRINIWYRKDFAFEDFKKDTGDKNLKVTQWKRRLVAYCKFMKYEFNPASAGGNIHKVKYLDPQGLEKETSKECIYIKTGTLAEKLSKELVPGDAGQLKAF